MQVSRLATVPLFAVVISTLVFDGSAQSKSGVVFVGDSLVERWDLPQSFPEKAVFNEGRGGQTCAEVAARFDQDVLTKHARDARTVVILCGMNDRYRNPGYAQVPQVTLDAIGQMIAAAKKQGWKVILATVPPVEKTPTELMDKQFRDYERLAQKRHASLVDLYHPLLGRPEMMTEDHMHPNASGFALMTRVMEPKL
jgi:lysophospholipase L1-like esterase